MCKDKFIGSWSLISYKEKIDGHDKEFFPCGENPSGIIIYTESHVSVHIMRSDRKQSSDLQEVLQERGKNYGGYVGSYTIQENEVVHYPQISGFIDFIGRAKRRVFNFDGDHLILTCEEYNAEHKNITKSELIWKRVKI